MNPAGAPSFPLRPMNPRGQLNPFGVGANPQLRISVPKSNGAGGMGTTRGFGGPSMMPKNSSFVPPPTPMRKKGGYRKRHTSRRSRKSRRSQRRTRRR